MIKKLRIKFILLAMLSLLLVLIVIMGLINSLSYRNLVNNADRILAVLAENDGKFPQFLGGPGAKPNNKPGMHKKDFSPEAPYENRYFTVWLDAGGNVIATDTGKIAAVDSDSAGSYAADIWKSGKNHGFTGDYRYIRSQSGDNTLIIFLDQGRNLATFNTFLLTSCGISALGLGAVFILLVTFSGRIIKPVSESYEKQKQFISDAGHEIKTPLTIIDADAEILAMEHGENEWIQDIQSQTRRLAELTNDLISLSRMDEDTAQIQMIEFPISDMTEETVQSFQSLAKVGGKSITSKIQPMLSLQGDEKSLRQMLGILLDNALKYSDDNGKIDIMLEKQGRNICLTVSNTTPAPIPQEQISHLFDRFYRGDQSRNSKTGGYGIGLSIAKAVVATHKGRITATTMGESGLKVTVTLPS